MPTTVERCLSLFQINCDVLRHGKRFASASAQPPTQTTHPLHLYTHQTHARTTHTPARTSTGTHAPTENLRASLLSHGECRLLGQLPHALPLAARGHVGLFAGQRRDWQVHGPPAA